MPNDFLDPVDVAHWGLKSASVQFLKHHGLYSMPVIFVDDWTSEEDLIARMKTAGLVEQGQNELGMSIRFSPREDARYQLSRWALPTYRQAAQFLFGHNDRFQSGTFLVFDAQIPHFMGEILKRADNTYHVEIVPGTWATSGIEPTDYADINGSAITFNAYQRPRRVLARLKRELDNEPFTGEFLPRYDEPLNIEMIKILARKMVEVTQRLTQLSMPSMLYEFCMNHDMIVNIKEAKVIKEEELLSTIRHSEDFFELNVYDEFETWDGIKPLYLTVDAGKNQANMFQDLVGKLKGRVKKVYIKYGLLTHPAILLREAGIQPITLRSQYKEYRFVF